MTTSTSPGSAERRALAALRQMKKKLNALERERKEPIAIIGTACRFPGDADSPEAFWQMLREARDGITETPPSRWDANAYYDPERGKPGKMNTRWAGYLKDIDHFNTHFFGISPREADLMDPQQRLTLELAYEALEDAGETLPSVAGSRTGVYVGIAGNEYLLRQSIHKTLTGGLSNPLSAAGNSPDVCAGRVAYQFDLRGPTMSVNTACSSSLVALHLACQALRMNECDRALVGGVNALVEPEVTVAMSNAGFFASDGRCKTFDASADGYVRGEGCGMVVVKRLSSALENGDRILALVRGSAVNQDGYGAGLTAPNAVSQRAVIRQALSMAKVQPSEISYVEAHGTGTSLGDPIEVEALTEVMGAPGDQAPPCALASLKANVGHLEAAAGVAGVIKVVLAFQHGEIPPHRNLKRLNPSISLEDTRFFVPDKVVAWPRGETVRRAGVSSFAWSGTNAHAVLEEAPREPETGQREPDAESATWLLPVSARDPKALEERALQWADFIEHTPETLGDVIHTANVRRTHHAERTAVVGRTREELAEALRAVAQGRSGAAARATVPATGARRVAFVFSGQGSQWSGMGRELWAAEPVFREAFEACDAEFRRQGGPSPREALLEAEASELSNTERAQPVIFALGVALSPLSRSGGVEPEAVLGHSIGEVSAAYEAGVLSLPQAVQVVLTRSRAMEQGRGGRMVSLLLSESQAQAWVEEMGTDRLDVAAVNAPQQTVISGEAEAVESLLERCRTQDVGHREVRVEYAFHSPQMEESAQTVETTLSKLRPEAARIAFYSTLTGERASGESLDARYWGRNVRERVRFAAAVEQAAQDGIDVFLEVGGHPVLQVPLLETLEARGEETPRVVGSLRRDQPDPPVIRAALGQLWTWGVAVDLETPHRGAGRVVSLPNYPWQHAPHWFVDPQHEAPRSNGVVPRPTDGASRRQPLLHASLTPADGDGLRYFETDLRRDDLGYITDHRAGGMVWVPGAFYAEMALEAATELFDGRAAVAEHFDFERALVLPEDRTRILQLVASKDTRDAYALEFHSRDAAGGPWQRHASATLRVAADAEAGPGRLEVEEIQAGAHGEASAQDFYTTISEKGLELGESFQVVERVWWNEREALGRVRIAPSEDAACASHVAHPTLIDAALQIAGGTWLHAVEGAGPFLPAGCSRLRVYRPLPSALWIHASMHEQPTLDSEEIVGDVVLTDDSGEVVAELEGARFRRFVVEETEAMGWLYEPVWRSKSAAESSWPEAAGSWLVLMDEAGVGKALAERLEARGERCVRVESGEAYAHPEGDRFVVPFGSSEAFERVFRTAFGRSRPLLRGVVDLWSLTDEEDPWAAQERGSESALALVQGLARAELSSSPRLLLATRGAQSVDGEPVSVGAAPLWGLAKVILLEHPEMSPRCVDLDPAESSETSAQTLWHELAAADGETEVAWRGTQRFGSRLVRAGYRLAEAAHLRQDATYVVTGGLGGLGLALAPQLAAWGARHLVLLGRSGPTPEATAVIDSLRSEGCEVRVAAADVSDRAALAEVIECVRSELPAIRGVLHAAGVLDDATLLSQDQQSMRRVMAPKLGAWNLHELLSIEELDFFVLFSSVASLLGSPGQSNYAAGNAFLDALAHHRRARGEAALSINWGPWSAVGMAAERSFGGFTGLSPSAGGEVLRRLITSDTSQLGVMNLDLRQWFQLYPALSNWPRFEELAQSAEPAVERGAWLNDLQGIESRSERLAVLGEHVKELVAEALGVEANAVDPGWPLADMGLDSMIAVSLKHHLEQQLAVSLPTTLLFAYPTLATLIPELAHRAKLISDEGEVAGGYDATGLESGEIDDLMAEIGALSDDEIREMLEQDTRAGETADG